MENCIAPQKSDRFRVKPVSPELKNQLLEDIAISLDKLGKMANEGIKNFRDYVQTLGFNVDALYEEGILSEEAKTASEIFKLNCFLPLHESNRTKIYGPILFHSEIETAENARTLAIRDINRYLHQTEITPI